MWKLLRIIFVIKVHFIYGKLVGDHICYTEESYLANVTENYSRNITVRHYQWCYNVPPRCSYYTIKEINDTQIVEKNQTRTIETCCAGFIEKDDKCIYNCTECRYGECNNGSCLCPPGFKGNFCDVACDFGEWGLNCSRKCDCGTTVCNPKTGFCTEKQRENNFEKIVQATPATNNETVTVSTIPLNENKTQNIHSYVQLNSEDNDRNRSVFEYVNPAKSSTKELEVSAGYREVANTHPTPTRSIGTEKNYGDARLVTDISTEQLNYNSIDVLEDEERSNHSYNSNLSTNLNKNIAGTKQTKTETVLETPLEQFKSSTESAYTNTSKYNDSNEGFLIPVGIKYDQQQNSQPKNIIVATTSYGHSEDYMLVPREGFTKKHAPSDDVVSIHSLTIVVISVFVVIILVVAIMIVSYTRSNRRKERLQKGEGTATVSFIATSIFHKPLPDPPTTENPMYLTPVPYHRGIKEAPTFETSILCNFNAPNRPISDCREYLYDHPPSTGSYRAASCIDPLDLNRASVSEEAEPLYDEIRYKEDSDQTYEGAYQYPKPLSIYINTFGKTKF